MPGAMVLNGSEIEFTYTRFKAAMSDGVTFMVEWSDTLLLSSWSNAGVGETIPSEDSAMQQVKATLPMGTSGRRFVHLRVTRP